MLDIKTLGYLRNLVNEQLRRQDCECLSEDKLLSMKGYLDIAIDAMYLRKLIKHIEDAMPSDTLNEEELGKAMDAFYDKKFIIGFNGMSVNLPVSPEVYGDVLQLLQDYYDEWYAGEGMTYSLRRKLIHNKFHLNYVDANGSDPEKLDDVVKSQYAVQSTMSAIIDDLINLL